MNQIWHCVSLGLNTECVTRTSKGPVLAQFTSEEFSDRIMCMTHVNWCSYTWMDSVNICKMYWNVECRVKRRIALGFSFKTLASCQRARGMSLPNCQRAQHRGGVETLGSSLGRHFVKLKGLKERQKGSTATSKSAYRVFVHKVLEVGKKMEGVQNVSGSHLQSLELWHRLMMHDVFWIAHRACIRAVKDCRLMK